jgi:hypothetical protein
MDQQVVVVGASQEEIAVLASYVLGPDAGFVSGSDVLSDGGVIAAMRAGLLPSPKQTQHDLTTR